MGKKISDLNGKQFGNWIVLYEDGRNKCGQVLWHCKCVCGSEIERNITSQSLRFGTSKGCGKCNKGCKRTNVYDISGGYGMGYTSNTNKPFYFDLEDYNIIKDYLWRENDNGYCVAQYRKHDSRKYIRLHRLIMNVSDEKQIDHINHNRLDNRKTNLRIVSNQENSFNKKVEGVYWDNSRNKWVGSLTCNGVKYQKRFDNYEDAKLYRLNLEKQYFKEYSYNHSK